MMASHMTVGIPHLLRHALSLYRGGFATYSSNNLMHLLVFADRKYTGTLRRIRMEAAALPFEGVFAWQEEAISPDYFSAREQFFRTTRGFGYWLWKPLLVLKALAMIPEGAALLYCDAGCRLNPEGAMRLKAYEALARESDAGILGFRLGDSQTMFKWTKMDTLLRIGGDGNAAQICTTAFVS
jgi:hypothetical protein